MVVSGLESKDTRYFYALKGENCEWKYEVHWTWEISKEKNHIRFYVTDTFSMFQFVVLHYFSSLVSFSGGMLLAFLVDLGGYLISSSILCVPVKFFIDSGHTGPQGITF